MVLLLHTVFMRIEYKRISVSESLKSKNNVRNNVL